ncbi:MAG: GIY-YIG nuclease family protein [Bacteroidales bacterium]
MFFVYVLKSKVDGRYYKGMAKDVQSRLKEHNNGKVKSTKGYRPWKLIYTKGFEKRIEARKFEKYLKSGSGREYIKNKLDL